MQKAAEFQKNIQSEAEHIKRFENEYKKVLENKGKLQEKKQENEMVISEFKLLAEGSCVYKLVGPILAKQELSEATENVTKRIEFMDKEIARQDALETEF